ncbi:MAG: 4-hydroxy-tetrahydrodipicolinate reductase [Christensenellales bacterium]
MIKIIICGANGRMGQALACTAENSEGICVVAGVDKLPDCRKNSFPVYADIFDCRESADIIIDFSRPDALRANLVYAKHHGLPIVIATTGFSVLEKDLIKEASSIIPVFFSANMSIGVNLQIELAKKAAYFLGEDCDIEIIEKHHNQKVDSPSGTALAIADGINDALMAPRPFICGRKTQTEARGREIGIHAVRGGTIAGDHSVMFICTDEIIEINHHAQSRRIFALGALRAASFLCGKPAGIYDMNDIITQNAVTNVYKVDSQAVVTLARLPFSPKIIARIFNDVAEADIKIDIISQTAPHDGRVRLSFSLPEADIEKCASTVKKYAKDETLFIETTNLSKLTVEGAGMRHQSGVAARLFGALAEKNIGISIITTSETAISFCVDAGRSGDAIAVVAEAFCL